MMLEPSLLMETKVSYHIHLVDMDIFLDGGELDFED